LTALSAKKIHSPKMTLYYFLVPKEKNKVQILF